MSGSDAYQLDRRRGVLIDPCQTLDLDPDLLYSKPYGEARYRWGLHHWRQRWRAAEMLGDHYMLDVLDRQFDLIGLP